MEIIAGGSSLWWDMESCALPSSFDPYIVSSMAPALLRKFNITHVNAGGVSGRKQHHFSAFEFFSQPETELHQTLINSGIRVHQLPPGKTSKEIEKTMVADVLLWAMDTPPPADIIFIVGNVDFCYVFQKLRQRSYNVFLVCPSMSQMPQGMLSAANDCLGWLPFLVSLQDEDRQLQPYGAHGSNSVYARTFSDTAFPATSTSIHGRELDGLNNTRSSETGRQNLFSQPSYSGGWGNTCSLPFDETSSSPLPTEPGFHSHFIRTKKPGNPVSSTSSTEKNISASLEEFKAWLTLVVNGKKHAENGYYIGLIHMDFRKATGKILDEKLLGFSDIRNLVEKCKDIAVLKEVKRGCHLAFTVKPKEQNKNPMSSPGGVNPNPNRKLKSKHMPNFKAHPKLKPKASAENFREFICHMLVVGEFSQGFLMSGLRQRFEQHTGKFLDVKHLGYKNMSELVASHSHLVSVGCAGPGPIRIFPSDLVSDKVLNLNPNSNTIKETSIKTVCDPTNLKAKVEADRPSTGRSGKELLENRALEENIFNEQLAYMSTGTEWLPSMTTGSRPSVSFSPYREANSPAFQEYNSIISDSSSTPGGSQVSETEGQSSNTISDTTSFHGELEGSDFIKQHVSTLHRESNDPIEDSVHAEYLMSEAMQNMRLMKENANLCGEPSIHGGTLGLPDSIPPPSDSPTSEPQADITAGDQEEPLLWTGHDLHLFGSQNRLKGCEAPRVDEPLLKIFVGALREPYALLSPPKGRFTTKMLSLITASRFFHLLQPCKRKCGSI
jgi:hypothetical protein